MGRCLLGVFVLTAGLVALASATREARSSLPETAPAAGNRLRESVTAMPSCNSRTLLLPAPAFALQFSLN